MKLAYALISALALMVLPGCGSSIASLCDDVCDCEGCNDNQRADCIDDLEDLQKLADHEGCGDQFDDLLDCYADEFECRGGDVDIDGCGPEIQALGRCIN